MQKKVSVILPIYNASTYLKECIDSLINQTYSNIEIIAINDGSTDESVKIIEQYMKKDNRIKLYNNEKNMKLIYTLNKGLSLSSGDYIARMDSDDICRLNRIEKQVEFMEKNKDIQLCGSKIKAFGDIDKPWTWGKSYKNIGQLNVDLIFDNVIAHPSVMIRGDFIRTKNLEYSTEYIDAEDYELWSRISYEGKIYNIDEVLLDYRVSGNSITATKQESMIKSKKKVIKRNLNRFKINLSGNEKKIIDYLIDEDWNVLNDNILTLRKVFIKMIEFNDKNTLYDSKYLNYKLERKLLKAFLTKNKNIFKYIFNICISKKSLINTIIK